LSFKIAVSGKGGTGKTTIAGLIIGYLLKKGKAPILAVDADANANLNEVLGVKYEKTIGRVREELRTDVPVGMTKGAWFELKAQEALIETKNFDLLVMGRPEGSGCYCVANALAREYIDVLTKNYGYIVMDNEAGMEHFSRLTTHDVDLLFIISDSSIRGLHAARRILDLIRELHLTVAKTAIIVSQVRREIEPVFSEEAKRLEVNLAGVVPFDERIAAFDREGRPTFNLPESSPAVQAMAEVLDNLL